MSVAIINKQPLLSPQRVEVRDEGEMVAIRLGDGEVGMHWEDALRFANLVRDHAKRAMHRKLRLLRPDDSVYERI